MNNMEYGIIPFNPKTCKEGKLGTLNCRYVSVNCCLSLMWPCNELVTCPGCHGYLNEKQIGIELVNLE